MAELNAKEGYKVPSSAGVTEQPGCAGGRGGCETLKAGKIVGDDGAAWEGHTERVTEAVALWDTPRAQLSEIQRGSVPGNSPCHGTGLQGGQTEHQGSVRSWGGNGIDGMLHSRASRYKQSCGEPWQAELSRCVLMC